MTDQDAVIDVIYKHVGILMHGSADMRRDAEESVTDAVLRFAAARAAEARAAERERIRQAAIAYWHARYVTVEDDYLPRWFADLLRNPPT
jgi:hypothetical protein